MTGATILPVTDLDHPSLEPYRDQKDAWLRARHNPDASGPTTGTGLDDGLFMAEGELVFEQLIASRHEVVSVLISESRLEGIKPLLDRLLPGTPVFVGPTQVLEQVLGFRMHRGVLACGRAKTPMAEDELADSVRTIVALEDLANHDNVGGIFRCVRGLAGPRAGVLLSPRCCDPLYRRALRVSIGHALHVPWAWATDWPGAIDRLGSMGFEVWAMTPAIGSVGLEEACQACEERSRVCVLVGSEGPGLTDLALERAHRRVRIDMDAAVDSLNVMVSVALSLQALRGASRG